MQVEANGGLNYRCQKSTTVDQMLGGAREEMNADGGPNYRWHKSTRVDQIVGGMREEAMVGCCRWKPRAQVVQRPTARVDLAAQPPAMEPRALETWAKLRWWQDWMKP